MNQNAVRFGIVGAGAIAQSYALAFESCSMAQVAAGVDARSDAAAALAERLKCKSFTSHSEMAKKSELDAVLICTPPNTHADLCVEFLERGIAVLCEKPLSIDVPSAQGMIETSRRTGVKMTMASKFRFVQDVVLAKALLTSGILGDIVLIENVFTSRVNMTKRWNSDPGISGGGVLIDNGTHSVDLIRFFLGPLAEIHVVEGKRARDLPVEETVHVFVRSTSGVLGTVDLSWSINKEIESYLRIYGSEGTISVGWKDSRFLLSGSRDWHVFGKGYDKVQAFRSQIENFACALRGEEPLLLSLEDAMASVQVIEAAYASLRDSHWVPIPFPGSSRTSVTNPAPKSAQPAA
ncbi:MAG: oxidoreductase [Cyanobacteria bacterium 13_1_40CM_2_61_4]|nr:MAG: oxidoreductase [Cyanobacteria bacterium 13_1_40CM_2_61_4]